MRCTAAFGSLILATAAWAVPTGADILPFQSCQGTCAKYERHQESPPPILVGKADSYGDIWAEVVFIADKSGHIPTLHLLQVRGPPALGDYLRQQAKRQLYKPDTLDGQPITMWRLGMLENFDGYWTVDKVGDAVAALIQKDQALVAAGKPDEAMVELSSALQKPEATLAERVRMLAVLVPLQDAKGDYADVLEETAMTEHTYWHRRKVPAPTLVAFARFHLRAALATGDIAEAMLTVGRLQQIETNSLQDPAVVEGGAQLTKLNGMEKIALTAVIPRGADAFFFRPYRRGLSVDGQSGSVEHLTVQCVQGALDGDITPAAHWHIPEGWSDCAAFVTGAPGARFSVIETAQ